MCDILTRTGFRRLVEEDAAYIASQVLRLPMPVTFHSDVGTSGRLGRGMSKSDADELSDLGMPRWALPGESRADATALAAAVALGSAECQELQAGA